MYALRACISIAFLLAVEFGHVYKHIYTHAHTTPTRLCTCPYIPPPSPCARVRAQPVSVAQAPSPSIPCVHARMCTPACLHGHANRQACLQAGGQVRARVSMQTGKSSAHMRARVRAHAHTHVLLPLEALAFEPRQSIALRSLPARVRVCACVPACMHTWRAWWRRVCLSSRSLSPMARFSRSMASSASCSLPRHQHQQRPREGHRDIRSHAPVHSACSHAPVHPRLHARTNTRTHRASMAWRSFASASSSARREASIAWRCSRTCDVDMCHRHGYGHVCRCVRRACIYASVMGWRSHICVLAHATHTCSSSFFRRASIFLRSRANASSSAASRASTCVHTCVPAPTCDDEWLGCGLWMGALGLYCIAAVITSTVATLCPLAIDLG